MNRSLAAVLVLAVVLAGCGSQIQIEQVNRELNELARLAKRRPNATYVVDPPDQLTIEFPHNPELNRQVTVRQDGVVTLSILGDVDVAGMTTDEITARLKEEYSRYYREIEPLVTVSAFNSKKIFIYGEVGTTGAIPYTGEQTVADVIGLVGGVNRQAQPKKVLVIRGDPTDPDIFKVNLNKLIFEGDAQQNIFLAENDVIWVPPNRFVRVGYALDTLLFPVSRISAAIGAGFFFTQAGGSGNGNGGD